MFRSCLLACTVSFTAAVVNFRFYKWVVTDIRGVGELVQLAQFEFLDDNGMVNKCCDDISGGGREPTNSGETVHNLVAYDGGTGNSLISAKWIDVEFGQNRRSEILFDMGDNPSNVSAYRLTTANDFANRDPSSWILYGSMQALDPNAWVVLDLQTEYRLPVKRREETAPLPLSLPSCFLTAFGDDWACNFVEGEYALHKLEAAGCIVEELFSVSLRGDACTVSLFASPTLNAKHCTLDSSDDTVNMQDPNNPCPDTVRSLRVIHTSCHASVSNSNGTACELDGPVGMRQSDWSDAGCPEHGNITAVITGEADCTLSLYQHGAHTGDTCRYEASGDSPTAATCPASIRSAQLTRGPPEDVVCQLNLTFGSGQNCHVSVTEGSVLHPWDLAVLNCPVDASPVSAIVIGDGCLVRLSDAPLQESLSGHCSLVQGTYTEQQYADHGCPLAQLEEVHFAQVSTELLPSLLESPCHILITAVSVSPTEAARHCIFGTGQYSSNLLQERDCANVESLTISGQGEGSVGENCVARLVATHEDSTASETACVLDHGVYDIAQLEALGCPLGAIGNMTEFSLHFNVSLRVPCSIRLFDGDLAGPSCVFSGYGEYDMMPTDICSKDEASSAIITGEHCFVHLFNDRGLAGDACVLPSGSFNTSAFVAMGCQDNEASSLLLSAAEWCYSEGLDDTYIPGHAGGARSVYSSLVQAQSSCEAMGRQCGGVTQVPSWSSWFESYELRAGPASFPSARGERSWIKCQDVVPEPTDCTVTLWQSADATGAPTAGWNCTFGGPVRLPKWSLQGIGCPKGDVTAVRVEGDRCRLTMYGGDEFDGTEWTLPTGMHLSADSDFLAVFSVDVSTDVVRSVAGAECVAYLYGTPTLASTAPYCVLAEGRHHSVDFLANDCPRGFFGVTHATVIGDGCVLELYGDDVWRGSQCSVGVGRHSEQSFAVRWGCEGIVARSALIYNRTRLGELDVYTSDSVDTAPVPAGQCRVVLSGPSHGGWNCQFTGPAPLRLDTLDMADKGCLAADANVSVTVEGGCRVLLYQHGGFEGLSCRVLGSASVPSQMCKLGSFASLALQSTDVQVVVPKTCEVTSWDEEGNDCTWDETPRFACRVDSIRVAGPPECGVLLQQPTNGTTVCIFSHGSYTAADMISRDCAPNYWTLQTTSEELPALSYPPRLQMLTIGQRHVITPVHISGPIRRWWTEPELPGALKLHVDGIITGVVWNVSAPANYTVHVANRLGATVGAIVQLVVVAETTPTVSPVVGPGRFSYPSSPVHLALEQLSHPIRPFFTEGVAEGYTWSITPSLPSGLKFAAGTGVVSGTPVDLLQLTVFNISASNDAGTAVAYLELAVSNEEPRGVVSMIRKRVADGPLWAVVIACLSLIFCGVCICCICSRRRKRSAVATEDSARNQPMKTSPSDDDGDVEMDGFTSIPFGAALVPPNDAEDDEEDDDDDDDDDDDEDDDDDAADADESSSSSSTDTDDAEVVLHAT